MWCFAHSCPDFDSRSVTDAHGHPNPFAVVNNDTYACSNGTSVAYVHTNAGSAYVHTNADSA